MLFIKVPWTSGAPLAVRQRATSPLSYFIPPPFGVLFISYVLNEKREREMMVVLLKFSTFAAVLLTICEKRF